MVSRSSYTSFLDAASGDLLNFPQTPRTLPRVMTVPGIISDVANFLPLLAQKDLNTGRWCFSFDEDALLLQMKDGFSSETDVVYVGSLKVDVDTSEQEEVAERLLAEFNCVPTFLPPDLQKKFYHGFCKQYLWPLFHYMLPIKRFYRVKLGFFLHSPFPSSEIYRTLPVRDDILKALLNADLVGFHTFDYARHFLSCCSRMLGLNYESKRGHIGLEYFGRTVYVKILPVGIHMGQLESALNLPSTSIKVKEIQEQFKGKKIILGVDDMDIFKGLSLKLLAMEHLLQHYEELRGELVLVQIVNPARSTGKDVQEAKRETYAITERINANFGFPGYEPVVLIDHPVPFYEKTAYYALAECCIVNAVRDGMNLMPYNYIVCRQGTPKIDEALGITSGSSRTSTLVVSEFIGCSPSLSGAIRHYRFRIVALSPNFRKLSLDHIVKAYKRANRRAIFLDYDGTVVPQSSIVKTPSPEVISILNDLCNDPKNTVFIVSGRGKNSLSDWFAQCQNLGIAAEHGYFIRWSQSSNWESRPLLMDFDWKRIADPVMQLYTEATDGSYIETKESALVWHHQDADPDFGSCQAMELLDHLENVLANEPVEVKRGHHIVEVKPQGVSKGQVTEKILSTMISDGKPPDFVMCIGDDRSDEDMFESISSTIYSPSLPAPPEIFACTVGQKPSKARYYLDDSADVLKLLQGLARASSMKPKCSTQIQFSFESVA
ncbi:unnamed protein product, partial [Vitis vinifera]